MDRLFNCALLVGADRKREKFCIDCLGVVGQDDSGTGSRNPLDADEDPHWWLLLHPAVVGIEEGSVSGDSYPDRKKLIHVHHL